MKVAWCGVAVVFAILVGLAMQRTTLPGSQLVSRGFFRTMTPGDLLVLIGFAAWSFGLRVARWHVLARRLVPTLQLRLSFHSQIVGFALAITPGRVAELYKLRMLERAAGLPVAESLPAILVERLTDAAAFGSLAVVGGWLSWSGWGSGGRAVLWALPALGLVMLGIAQQLGSQRRPDWRRTGAESVAQMWVQRQPWLLSVVPRPTALLHQLQVGAARVTSLSALALALGCVTLGRLGDAMVVWQAARLVGHPVPFPAAMYLIASAGLAGGFSLLPGGVGAAEATLTVLAIERGIPLDAALTISLLARCCTYWLWVVLGLLVLVVGTGLRTAGRRG